MKRSRSCTSFCLQEMVSKKKSLKPYPSQTEPGCLQSEALYLFTFHNLCLSSSGEPYEFVPLDWLKKWLDDSTATKEIDNTLFLCSHGKLHPDKVADSKRISMEAAQLLYERYGGGPRLDGERNRSSDFILKN